MNWEDDFYGAMKKFIREGYRNDTAGVEAHIQAAKQAINAINVRTKSDKQNLDIVKLHLNHIKKLCRKMKREIEESRLDEAVESSNYAYDDPVTVLEALGVDPASANDAQKTAADLIALVEQNYFDDRVLIIIPDSLSSKEKSEIPRIIREFANELDIVIPVERIFLLVENKYSIARKLGLNRDDFTDVLMKHWTWLMVPIQHKTYNQNTSILSSDKFTAAPFSTQEIKNDQKDSIKYLWQVGALADLGAALSN